MLTLKPTDVHEALEKHMLVDGLDLVFDLERSKDQHKMTAFIKLPPSICRFVKLPIRANGEEILVKIEDVIECFIESLFPNYSINGYGSFRLIRDSDLEVEEDGTVLGVVELVGHGLIDGHRDRLRRGVDLVPGMDGQGLVLHGVLLLCLKR